MADIADVARAAGVSVSTVSRALRGRSGVSERTRQRVVAVAEELRYTISPSASGLVTGRTKCVGVVVPFVGRWFYGQVIAAAEAVLRDAGYTLMLHAVGDLDARRRFFHEVPLRRSVDAVLVVAMPLDEYESDILRGLEVPLALVGDQSEGFSSVTIDDRVGARTAVEHLVDLGHRDIGVVSEFTGPMGFTPARDRYAGYVDVLTELGEPPRADRTFDGGFTMSGGRRAMAELLAGDSLPTAVFAFSDEMAMGALRCLRDHGMSAPEDVSVVGFDDHEMAELVDLTTVRQPVGDQGATAARMLLEQLHEDEPRARDVVLPTELVTRGTTSVPTSTSAPRHGRSAGEGVVPGGSWA